MHEKVLVHLFQWTFLCSMSTSLRTVRDTYDEREKLISTYKIISKSQCLLQMYSSTGYVYGRRMTNFDQTDSSTFLFLPIAVNVFLIQHKQSQRYLCARHHHLFGSIERDERQCLFEAKRSDIDFGHWDSFRLFYEEASSGYLSMSNRCQTRLRRKHLHDSQLDSLAFVRINLDRSRMTSILPMKSTKLIRHYRHHWRRTKRVALM